MAQYICLDCGWIYNEALGIPGAENMERYGYAIPPGTKWEDLPDNFQCLECEVRKSDTDMWQKIA